MDLERVLHFVSAQVREAALQTAAQLDHLGIRFALAGGLAVGAHGYVRATDDVDFLVGEEAFEKVGLLVTFKPGVPIEVGGIKIDYLSAASLGDHLEAALDQAHHSQGVTVVPLAPLIYMKLVARRRKDLLDIVELLKRTARAREIRRYLAKHAPDTLPLFDDLLRESEE